MPPKPPLRRRALVCASVAVAVIGVVAAALTLNRAQDQFHAEHTRPLAVGDCVTVAASTASSTPEVATRRAPCTADPSYTVGALATSTGDCPSDEYQHFPGPAADRGTARLCLVPNLVADHCYRLGMPIGVVQRADCAEGRADVSDGLLVQVTQRLDGREEHACGSAGGQYVWKYPSPARTYCTATLY